MKKIRKLILIVGLGIALSVGVANATTYLLSDLIAGHIAINYEDKIFADWGFISSSISATGITVTPFGTMANNDIGLVFQGPFVAANGAILDAGLFYSVAINPAYPTMFIEDISQSFNLSGGSGIITIGETVWSAGFFNGGPVAQSTVTYNLPLNDYIDPIGEPFQADQLIISPGLKKVYVTKDIYLAAGATGTVGATVFTQQFSQAVPEPTTLLLLGVGLMGLALGGRRFKKG